MAGRPSRPGILDSSRPISRCSPAGSCDGSRPPDPAPPEPDRSIHRLEAGMSSTIALRSVMTTDVVTVSAELTLAEAADVLAEHGIGAAPVVDATGQVVGLLRDEDLLSSESRLHVPTTIAILGVNFTLPGQVARYDEELRKAIASTVGEVMETEFPHLEPDASLEDAATLMHETDVTHVVVLDAGRVVGVVARGDLVRYLARST